jgi:hypothetical protein
MKRSLLCLVIYFFLTSLSYAAPCYGTKLPGQNQIFAGLQTHSILKRYLADHNGKMSSLQNFVLISYGVIDWFCIDLKGGMGNIKQQSPNAARLDYSAYLGGGYGFRMKFYDNNKTKAVFGFQHISIHPHKVHEGGIKRKSVLDDWQFSLLASRDLPIITPYIGTKWSTVDYIIWTNGDRNRIKSDRTKNIGLVFGANISLGEKVWFNVEGNFFDSESFATSLNFSF